MDKNKLKKIKLLAIQAIDLLEVNFQCRRIRDHLQMAINEINVLEKILNSKNKENKPKIR